MFGLENYSKPIPMNI